MVSNGELAMGEMRVAIALAVLYFIFTNFEA